MKQESRILKRYQITYESNGFIQDKNLISKEDWEDILQPIKRIIGILEDSNNGKKTEVSKLLRESLNIMFGDISKCFPTEGPLYESIKTGILSLPETQGGDHKIIWKIKL